MFQALVRFQRHLYEWQLVLQEEGSEITWRTWWKMLRGALSRPVSARVFRARARVCLKCPIFDRELRRCRGPWFNGNPSGCGCYLIFFLRVRRPYPKGCWGRDNVGPDFGWPSE
jgi:hypothetical protein